MVPGEKMSSFSSWQRFLLVLSSPFTTGGEAVILFFVLSGFVLMLPYIKGTQQTYGIFVVRRILRIYGPYLCALALAVAGAAIWHGPHGMDAWGNRIWSKPISAHLVLQHVLMIGIYDWREFNPVFWTLIEEMRISLFYPVLAYIVLRLPAKYALLLAAILALFARGVLRIWHHADWIMTLEYTGMFLCGMVLARNFASVTQWYSRRETSIRIAIASLALGLYTTAHFARHASEWLMTIASAALIVIALASRRAGMFLSIGINRYLGRISYSLYLVHIPVLFALTITLNHRLPAWAILPLFISLSVLLASAFYQWIERPFTLLSRRVARVKVLIA